jgi:hypothetical protein
MERHKTIKGDKRYKVVKTNHGEFYVLSSGRKIPVPPRGGNVSREKIREAVRSAVDSRKTANLG